MSATYSLKILSTAPTDATINVDGHCEESNIFEFILDGNLLRHIYTPMAEEKVDEEDTTASHAIPAKEIIKIRLR